MRFLIVDDHPITRIGVRHLVESAWPEAEITEAESVTDAAAALRARPVDLIVLDLSLPDASGIEAPARLLRIAGEARILVLSLNSDITFAARLMQMGVAGYLPKDKAATDLVTALQRLAIGQRYVTPEMAEHLLGVLSGDAPAALPHEKLSAQEMRVMQMIAGGMTPAQIAEVMHLSVKTVGSYRARILAKGGWANNIEMAKYCVQHGLTDTA